MQEHSGQINKSIHLQRKKIMFRKLFIIVALVIVGSFYLSGCDKSTGSNESDEDVVVKTQAEYEAEAKEEITEENMESELASLEKEVEQEISEEP
jgi:outer membrane murein-binding lipoprotein Lpp